MFDLKLKPLLTEYLRAQFTEIEAVEMVKKARNEFVKSDESKVKTNGQNRVADNTNNETNSQDGAA